MSDEINQWTGRFEPKPDEDSFVIFQFDGNLSQRIRSDRLDDQRN